jgi:hypothetical protein
MDADDTLGLPDLGRRRQERNRPAALGRRQQLGGPLEVVAHHHRRVAGLLDRHPPVLATLDLDEVGDGPGVVDEDRMRPLEHRQPLLERRGDPLLLRRARDSERLLDVGRRRLRQLDEYVARVDLVELPGRAGRARHPGHESPQ